MPQRVARPVVAQREELEAVTARAAGRARGSGPKRGGQDGKRDGHAGRTTQHTVRQRQCPSGVTQSQRIRFPDEQAVEFEPAAAQRCQRRRDADPGVGRQSLEAQRRQRRTLQAPTLPLPAAEADATVEPVVTGVVDRVGGERVDRWPAIPQAIDEDDAVLTAIS